MSPGNVTARASLTVLVNKTTIFQSDGSWLHPLFELEEFVRDQSIELCGAEFRDKIVGKAAALLIARFGASRLHAEVLSELAVPVLSAAGIEYSFDTLVPRIQCQTEDILSSVSDPHAAYELLRARAGR